MDRNTRTPLEVPPAEDALLVRLVGDHERARARGDLAEEERALSAALARAREIDAPALLLATLATEMGNTYTWKGDHEEAQLHYVNAFQLLKALQGDNHPFTLKAGLNLARCFADQGADDDAGYLFAALLRMREVDATIPFEDVTVALRGLAAIYAKRGQHDEAAELFEKVAEGLARDHGATDPRVIAVRRARTIVLSHGER